jgi:hypothetical protein
VTPGIDQYRADKYDPATPPERAALADDEFDRYHHLSTRTYGVSTAALAAALLLSPWCFRNPAPTTEGSA